MKIPRPHLLDLLALAIMFAPLALAVDPEPNLNDGERVNPATSANTLANGGDVDAWSQTVNKIPAPKPVPDPGQIAAQRDRALARKVRWSFTKDGRLRGAGWRIDVRAKDGKVTLAGPVANEDEKIGLATKAAEAAGPGNVIDALEIEPAP